MIAGRDQEDLSLSKNPLVAEYLLSKVKELGDDEAAELFKEDCK